MRIVAGWLVPGGGYLLRRRYDRFALCCFLVLSALCAGMAAGGLNNPQQSGILAAAETAAMWLAGGPYLIARIFSHATLPMDAPVHEYGIALLAAAGMINLLALADKE